MSNYKKLEAGLLMQCNNTALIQIKELGSKLEISCDCPKCNFSCGFSKKHKRVRRVGVACVG